LPHNECRRPDTRCKAHHRFCNYSFIWRIFLNNIRTDVPHMPDQSAIHCTLRFIKPPTFTVTRTSRSYKYIGAAATCQDIRSLLLSKHLPNDVHYVSCTTKPLEPSLTNTQRKRHTRPVTVRPHTRWYNDRTRPQVYVRRQLERKWRISGLECGRL